MSCLQITGNQCGDCSVPTEFLYWLVGDSREPELPGMSTSSTRQHLLDNCFHERDEVSLETLRLFEVRYYKTLMTHWLLQDRFYIVPFGCNEIKYCKGYSSRAHNINLTYSFYLNECCLLFLSASHREKIHDWCKTFVNIKLANTVLCFRAHLLNSV
jgi:hypothetical protein